MHPWQENKKQQLSTVVAQQRIAITINLPCLTISECQTSQCQVPNESFPDCIPGKKTAISHHGCSFFKNLPFQMNDLDARHPDVRHLDASFPACAPS